MDGVNEILGIAERALVQRELCVAITMDVQNTFNSRPWLRILENLSKRGIDESLISVIASYFSDRKILLETIEFN